MMSSAPDTVPADHAIGRTMATVFINGVSIDMPEDAAFRTFEEIAARIESGQTSRYAISEGEGGDIKASFLITPHSSVSVTNG